MDCSRRRRKLFPKRRIAPMFEAPHSVAPGTSRRSAAAQYFGRFRSEADIAADFMSTRPRQLRGFSYRVVGNSEPNTTRTLRFDPWKIRGIRSASVRTRLVTWPCNDRAAPNSTCVRSPIQRSDHICGTAVETKALPLARPPRRSGSGETAARLLARSIQLIGNLVDTSLCALVVLARCARHANRADDFVAHFDWQSATECQNPRIVPRADRLRHIFQPLDESRRRLVERACRVGGAVASF